LTSRDRLYLTHILDAIQRIERFVVDGRAAFLADEKTQSAVYFAVRLDIVWNVVENELRGIRESVTRML
jgi:uncharacterized protein with HEPN domain